MCNNPEYHNLNTHYRDNLKTYVGITVLQRINVRLHQCSLLYATKHAMVNSDMRAVHLKTALADSHVWKVQCQTLGFANESPSATKYDHPYAEQCKHVTARFNILS
jgi:hypothetical protein